MKDMKKDFPILSRKVNGKPLIYLDNSATTQKPTQVIEAISNFYKNNNANVHRGIHTLSEESTQMYEDARSTVAKFINACPEEVIFTKGTSESLNRVAFTWAKQNLKKGDVILVSRAEHHSNLVPWQVVAKETGAKLEYLELNESGELTPEEVKGKVTNKVKVVAVAHASNVLGTIFPVKEICKIVRSQGAKGARVCVDGAQAAPHLKVNVKSLDCDFYSFSAHKMLGPTGIGVLWAKKELLEEMNPYEYGGGMIHEVGDEDSSWAQIPEKFEAGTPNIAGAIGFAAAVNYLSAIGVGAAGMDAVQKHEVELNSYAIRKLEEIKGLEILGPKNSQKRAGLVAFTVKGIHAHDVASVLDTEGVAVRAGHHCAMPFHTKLKISASVRASFYIYNTKEDIDALSAGVEKAIKILG
jgi:cysteine desulfurase / selenocysteine lyase